MRARRIFALLLCLAIAAGAAVFMIQRLTDRGNSPPDPGTPAPDPHTGYFESDLGSMRFNGDGSSIEISVSEKLAALSGLPQGDHSGTYEFLSGDLPPHGSVPVRYDVAHELRITVDGKDTVLQIGTASSDGSTYSVAWNTVQEGEIPLVFKEDGKYISVTFDRML